MDHAGGGLRKAVEELLSEAILAFDPIVPLQRQLNSLELVEFVIRLETEFGIQIHGIEFDETNFQTLESLVSFLAKKLAAKSK